METAPSEKRTRHAPGLEERDGGVEAGLEGGVGDAERVHLEHQSVAGRGEGGALQLGATRDPVRPRIAVGMQREPVPGTPDA